ncbi:hypothetical protein ACO0K3_11495 [Undibacterium sp. Rencai35W]|uniref:hypothetical protein n=1 Tax=Undibacterium sp. Rencai35W TaxID=3413046 RepID=UPI003BF08740
MHITTLQSAQSYQTYLFQGSQLHLNVGSIVIKEAPLSLDACAYVPQIVLTEGATYTVQRSGWLQICAQKRCEFLIELPETGMRVLLLARMKQTALKAIAVVTRRLRLG